MQALGLVGELALVDDEPGVGAAGRHLVEDPVEGQLAVSELAEREPGGQEGRRHPAGDDDLARTCSCSSVSGSRATRTGP